MARCVVLMTCLVLLVTGCTTSPPRQPNDLCHVFSEKDDWYAEAKQAEKKWGSPVHITMAFMRQESGFRADAKPPRGRLLWVIPWFRPSSAYGYPQAKDETWDWYQDKSGNGWSSRDNFDDAIDFVAWYNHMTHKRIGIQPTDTYSLYLAYHEGHRGFEQRSFDKKPWLKVIANKVSARASQYQQQLAGCEQRLQDDDGWFF